MFFSPTISTSFFFNISEHRLTLNYLQKEILLQVTLLSTPMCTIRFWEFTKSCLQIRNLETELLDYRNKNKDI